MPTPSLFARAAKHLPLLWINGSINVLDTVMLGPAPIISMDISVRDDGLTWVAVTVGKDGNNIRKAFLPDTQVLVGYQLDL